MLATALRSFKIPSLLVGCFAGRLVSVRVRRGFWRPLAQTSSFKTAESSRRSEAGGSLRVAIDWHVGSHQVYPLALCYVVVNHEFARRTACSCCPMTEHPLQHTPQGVLPSFTPVHHGGPLGTTAGLHNTTPWTAPNLATQPRQAPPARSSLANTTSPPGRPSHRFDDDSVLMASPFTAVGTSPGDTWGMGNHNKLGLAACSGIG